jgi:hypothetical protein
MGKCHLLLAKDTGKFVDFYKDRRYRPPILKQG